MTDVQRLMAARFLVNLSFAAPIQTLFLQARGFSLGHIMFLQSLLLGAALLLEIPTGMLGDRLGKKMSIVFGVGCALFAWIPWFLATDFWAFSLAFVLLGASQAFISGSDQALLYEILVSKGRQKDMQRVYGLYLAMSTFGFALAGLIGGFLAIHQTMVEFIRLYVLTAAAQTCAFFLLLSIREPRVTSEDPSMVPAKRRTLHIVLQLLTGNKRLRRIVLFSILTMPFSVALLTFFQPYFVMSSVPPLLFGVALFLSSLVASASKVFAHHLESAIGTESAVFLSVLLPGVLWILMALAFHPIIAVVLFILNDAAGNLRDPIFADHMNRHIPSSIRATTLSSISFLISTYALLTLPVIGILADFNLRYAFVCMGGIIVLAALAMRFHPNRGS